VLLLLDSSAEFEERVRNILFRCFQNVDQPKKCGQSVIISFGFVRVCRGKDSLTPLNAPCRFR
jgi:hypothetical protein